MNLQKSLTERILKGSLTVVVFASFVSPIGYLMKMIYARTLSIEMFGLFYAMLAFFLLLSSFSNLGFGYSLTYLAPKYLKGKNYKICWNLYKYSQISGVVASLLISLIVALSVNWLSKYYFKTPEAMSIIYVFLIFLVSGSLLNALEKFFIGLQQEKFYSTTQAVRIFFALTFSLFIWLIGKPNVINYALAWAIANICAVVLYTFFLNKKNGYLVNQCVWDKKLFKLMFKYAFPTILTTSVYTLITSTDMIFLTLLKDVREVGIYAIVLPLASISSVVLTPINTFFLPLISHLMEGEKEKVRQILQMSLKIIPFIGFYFALFITLFPEQPISILFGQKWVSLVKTPLIILSIGYIGAQISNFLATVVTGMGKVNERLKISILIALINVILTYFLVSRYSVLGVTIAGSVVFLISVILNARIIQKSIHFKFPIVFYFKLLAIGIVTYTAVFYFKLYPVGLLQYLLSGTIYTIIMGVLAYFLKLFDKRMLSLLFKN
jgi:O-antigen/teichoic acid export membrane protein